VKKIFERLILEGKSDEFKRLIQLADSLKVLKLSYKDESRAKGKKSGEEHRMVYYDIEFIGEGGGKKRMEIGVNEKGDVVILPAI